MSQDFEHVDREESRGAGWGLLSAFALIGLAAATLIVVSRTRRPGRIWSVDDLIDAADRAADNLERSLLGEKVRVS